MAARLPSSRSSAAKTSEKALQPWKRLHPFSPLNRVFKKSEWRACCVIPNPGGEVSQNSRSSQHIVVRWVTPYGRGSWEMEQCQAGKEPANRLAEVEYGRSEE